MINKYSVIFQNPHLSGELKVPLFVFLLFHLAR